MSESTTTVAEGSSVEIDRGRTVKFYLCIVLLLTFLLFIVHEWSRLSTPCPTPGNVASVLTIVAVSAYLAYRFYWRRRRRIVRYRLDGARLLISRTNADKSLAVGETNEYNLHNLWLLEVLREQVSQPNSDGTLTILPKRLLLAFDVMGAPAEKVVLLTRAPLRGLLKDQQDLEHALSNWNGLCSRIESQMAPQTMARLWGTKASAYERYELVLMEAEVRFLKGLSTPGQMCLASLRELLVLLSGGLKYLGRGLKWSYLWYIPITLVAVMLIFILGVNRYFYDERGFLTPEFYIFLLLPALISPVLGLISWLRPLTEKIQQDQVRHEQAQRLVRAQASSADLETILKFISADLERILAESNWMGLIVGLISGAAGAVALFKESFGHWGPLFYVIAATGFLSFALVQLYYHVLIQILRQANTACLIAQAQGPSATDTHAR